MPVQIFKGRKSVAMIKKVLHEKFLPSRFHKDGWGMGLTRNVFGEIMWPVCSDVVLSNGQ